MTSPFLDPLLPTPAPADARYIWAVVTQASPLRIQVDGDRTPLGITPDSLVSGLAVDQRVYCQIINRRLVVLGCSGGAVGTALATPSTWMMRDAAGRSRVVAPLVAADIDTMGARDTAITAALATAAAYGTAAATASTIVRRDASGRSAFAAGVASADAAVVSQLPNPNLFANPIFAVNQRAAASGTSLALGAYFLDRLKSGTAANAVTWTGDDISGRVLTIPSGKTVISPQERANFPAGVYTISWGGTATGRFYKSGTSAPALAASPITVTADGLADMLAEWGAGTLSWVKIERGAVATPLVRGTFAEELAACRRYFRRYAPEGSNGYFINMAAYTTSYHYGGLHFQVPMRAAPTMTPSSSAALVLIYQGVSINSSTITAQYATKDGCRIEVSCGGSITAGYSSWCEIRPGYYIDFSAEL